ncbi:MAG: hypothetical protein ACI9QA_000060 [Methanobacteriota archaeon]|jgi:hypothetical protein
MRRGVAVALALVAVALLTGCLSPLPEEGEVDYTDRWNTSAETTYYIDDDTFTAVVDVGGLNGSEFEIWERDPFGGDSSVQVAGVRFRDDGNVTNVSNVDTSGDRTVIELPAEGGRLAYTATKSGTSFTHPSPVSGSVEAHLPPGTDARDFFLGRISPGSYNVTSEEPLVVRWGGLERGRYVTVEYYQRGYPYVLIGVLVLLLVSAVVVFLYYRRRLSEMEEKQVDP